MKKGKYENAINWHFFFKNKIELYSFEKSIMHNKYLKMRDCTISNI